MLVSFILILSRGGYSSVIVFLREGCSVPYVTLARKMHGKVIGLSRFESKFFP